LEKLEKRLRSLEKDVKELKRIETEQNKFLKSWDRYFEARDKKDEERDKATKELCRILGNLQKIGKSKALNKFLREASEFQERGRRASEEYVR